MTDTMAIFLIILVLIYVSFGILILMGGKELNNSKIFFAGVLWLVGLSLTLVIYLISFNKLDSNYFNSDVPQTMDDIFKKELKDAVESVKEKASQELD